MGKVTMILRKSPYGDINAAEAIRHAIGGISDEMNINLILVASGVLLAKKGQDITSTRYTNLEGSLKVCIDMGVEVYADRFSVREQYLEPSDIVDGVKIIDEPEIVELIKEAQTTMIF